MHHLADEAMACGDRGFGIVDELRLHEAPALREPLRILRRQRPDVQTLHRAARACRAELGRAHITGFAHRALVLRTETLTQARAPLSSRHDQRDTTDATTAAAAMIDMSCMSIRPSGAEGCRSHTTDRMRESLDRRPRRRDR